MSQTTNINSRIYLDYASATPLGPEVIKAMLEIMENNFGNPSAIHLEGQKAREILETARAQCARILGIKPAEIFFTGSGTESNNLAILGYLRLLNTQGRKYDSMEIITTAIEHPSILKLLPEIESLGVRVTFVAVDEYGSISTEALKSVLSPATVLCTFAYANSEIGTVQAVSRLSRVVREYEKTNQQRIAVHIDGAQAPLWLPCMLSKLGVDMLSLDAGKCYGPKGVGLVASRLSDRLKSITFGGGQEDGVRPGTENVVGIVGMATALELAQSNYETRAEKVRQVSKELQKEIYTKLPFAVVNGSIDETRLANNLNISLPGIDTEYAVVWMDKQGISASTKSACSGAGSGQSHVVFACTGDEVRSKSTIRFSLGDETTIMDVQRTVEELVKFYDKMSTLT